MAEWKYPLYPPQAAEVASPYPEPTAQPQPQAVPAPGVVLCEHCGGEIELHEECVTFEKSIVRRGEKSGQLMALPDNRYNDPANYVLHESCVLDFVIEQTGMSVDELREMLLGDEAMYCAGCEAKLR